MKKIIISLMILSMLTACAGAVAEAPRNGGRGNGAGGGSMQTLNEGIAYMNGEFPVLKPGANAISWTGTVTKVVVRPNWRFL